MPEIILNEDKRSELISKSKKGDNYSPSNQALGKNRYERRLHSHVANSVKEFNSINMNKFFKEDILDVNVVVNGETNDYIVRMSFGGIVENIKSQIQRNNGQFNLRSITRALIDAFNRNDVYIHCTCLHEDTKIKLLDGTTPTIKEMCARFEAGEQMYVYSADENGDFKPGLVEKVWKTDEATEFIKIVLDNDEEILVTPDHQFMLRDGTYTQAINLKPNMSLMPMYTKFDHGYELVQYNSTHRYHSTYKLVADYFKHDEIEAAKSRVNVDDNMKYDVAIHHIDFNKLDNNPENLRVMTAREHWNYHNSLTFENRSDYYASLSPEDAQALSRRRTDGKIIKVLNALLSQGLEISFENYEKVKGPKSPKLNKFFNSIEDVINYYALDDRYNHKIVKVERIHSQATPVYDIKVKDFHNFTLNSGVVVHNCPDWKYRFDYWATYNDITSGDPQHDPGNFIVNPNDTKGAGCKHTLIVLSNNTWLIKVSSVIYNYVNYMEKHFNKLYADIIYPALFDKEYEKDVQLDLNLDNVPEDELDTSDTFIDTSNKWAKTKGQFKKGNKSGIRFASNKGPKQLDFDSLLDDEEAPIEEPTKAEPKEKPVEEPTKPEETTSNVRAKLSDENEEEEGQ